MAQASFHQPQPSFGQSSNSSFMTSPLYQRRGVQESNHSIELLPNPDFVFPPRSTETSPTLDNWNALNRRPQSSQQSTVSIAAPTSAAKAHRQRGSANALPNFSFNPSTSTAAIASPPVNTPPHSPSLPTPTTPSRGIGHRRGGSEFIGGDGKGGVGLMSTSPTKGESMLPPPGVQTRLGPPSGGPGHRHRRSGAISCHDLQSIMQPKENTSRGGSAPATPLEADQKPFFTPGQRRRTASQAEIRTTPEAAARSASDGSPPRVIPRVRVGFSDRVEYIRPLSTISSETESSMSTIRGHSVSGSMSSVISMGTASPSSARMARPSLRTTFEDENVGRRPSSSGAILEAMTKGKELFHVQWEDNERPKSSASSPAPASPLAPSSPTATRSPKRKSFSWWETKRPSHALRSSVSEPSLHSSPPTSRSSQENSDFSMLSEDASSPEGDKSTHKPKKAKSWTRSLISRKSKSHGNLKVKPAQNRIPTPPSARTSPLEIHSPAAQKFHFGEPETFEPNFDIDDTVTIVSEESRANMSLSPFRKQTQSDSDPMSPVIDLDAALGPFNTPPFGANSRGTPSWVQPKPRRSMHSLGYQSSMNHRRTESAPELVPFDVRAAKATPATTMPDVFEEEDEEYAEECAESAIAPDDFSTPITEDEESAFGITIVETACEDMPTPTRRAANRVKQPTARPSSIRSTHGNSSLSPGLALQPEPGVIDVVEDFEEPRAASFTRDSDSTITPPLLAEDEKAPRPIMSLALPLPQQPLMTPDTLTGSSFSSRTFSSSQASLSTPRLGTATSSGTDNRSFSFGEPGPAVRMSVDDVPSLSSSRSTMTTPPQNPFLYANPCEAERRTSSIASIPSLDQQRRRSKRSSVASLSRLVGVKSKLSIETRPQSQHMLTTLPSKTKKTNRLSKLINFWKKPSDSRRPSVI